MRRRFDEAETQWRMIDELVAAHRLNERVGTALFDALLGLRVTRPSYVKLTELDERTATRDLVKRQNLACWMHAANVVGATTSPAGRSGRSRQSCAPAGSPLKTRIRHSLARSGGRCRSPGDC